MRIRLISACASGHKFVACIVACLAATLLTFAVSCKPEDKTAAKSGDACTCSARSRSGVDVPTANSESAAPATKSTTTAPSTQPVVEAPPPPAPVYECRWTETPITIDGKADEPAWKHAQVIDHFVIPWNSGDAQKPIEATKAKVLWDREYFYYFADMVDTDLFAIEKEHNGRIWEDDCFEVFFKPDEKKHGYYEFEVNALNTRMEIFMPSRNSGGWGRYKLDSKIQHDTAVVLKGSLNNWRDKDTGWSVEGRIRWRDFAYTGGRPTVGESWKFALCRGNVGNGIEMMELTSCAPFSKRDFHHYEDFATLKFIRPDAGGPTTAPAATGAPPFGISTHVPLTTSTVVGSPDPALPFTVAKAFPKLDIKQPIYIADEPGTNNFFLLQHLGYWSGPARLSRFNNDPNVATTEEILTLDHLVYGMTLHPDFIHNGFIYLIANGPAKAENKQNRIMRYTMDLKTGKIDPKSQLIYLEWDSNGHNGGDLAFGPDGYLYYCAGDSTSDSDTNDRGQKTNFLTSKMLRLDVDHPADGKLYSVPKDNPWVDKPGYQPEGWAMGFRNPWRLAFDRKTGDLWVGQNGQDLWEQVYLVHKGENYGWSRFEGSHPFQPLRTPAPIPITNPIVEHSHSEMRSLTGGIVYHGSKYPELDGAFIYGDYSTGRIWGVKSADHKTATWHKELARTTVQITSFHETPDGDILITEDQSGQSIYKMVPLAPNPTATLFPRKLSETGLFVSTKENKPEPGLIPYDVNSPLWSDGALKERFIAIPGNGKIDVTPNRGWVFPEGTVLVKTFSLELKQGDPASQKRIETRLFTRQMGQWVGYSYLWNDEQTDADLVADAGIDKTYTISDPAAPNGTRAQTWHYPSRTECSACHSRASQFVLGVTTLQLNRDFVYPSGVKDNQLRVLEHLGLLHVDYLSGVREAVRKEYIEQGKTPKEAGNSTWYDTYAPEQRVIPSGTNTMLPFNPDHIDHLTNPYDTKADINLRARSYLTSNCAICHVPAGGGNGLMVLEYGIPPAECQLFDAKPQHETFGIAAPKIIATGHADASVLLHRVSIRGTGQMPPLASSRVDEAAVKMLREWIDQLKPLPPAAVETEK